MYIFGSFLVSLLNWRSLTIYRNLNVITSYKNEKIKIVVNVKVKKFVKKNLALQIL